MIRILFPFVLSAPSGAAKSSLMEFVAKKVIHFRGGALIFFEKIESLKKVLSNKNLNAFINTEELYLHSFGININA